MESVVLEPDGGGTGDYYAVKNGIPFAQPR
jgi:hypothetical protein